MATSSGTNAITLAASTKYQLTAGGSTYIFTTPPNTNTTYSAGTGISLSGTTFSNSGVRAIGTGTSNGTISVNTNGTTKNVSVKGLGSAAYTASTAYAAASHSHSYLPLSGGTMTGHIYATSEFYLKPASGTGNALIWHPSADKLTIATKWGAGADGCALEIMAGDGIWSFCPRSSGQLSCGRPNSKVNAVYANNGSIITSDRNAKKDINEIGDKYYTLFDSLKPVSYKMIDGTSGRTHIGFVAQDVEDAMTTANLSDLEFAGFCKDKKTQRIEEVDENGTLKDYREEIILDKEGNPEYIYSLRYEEFIALNTMAIKSLQKKVTELEKKIEELQFMK